MFDSLIGRLRCRMGTHRRSRSKARLIDGFYRSKCSYCGRAMREAGPEGWELDEGRLPPKNSGRRLDLE